VKGLSIKKEIREQFNKLPENHQLEVFFWCWRKGIVKWKFRKSKIRKPKFKFRGEINKQMFEQALKELKESGEIS